MPRKNSRLSPATALHLVEILIEEGKLAALDITRHLKIAELETRLRALRGGEVPVPHVRGRRRGLKPAKHRKKPISAERRAVFLEKGNLSVGCSGKLGSSRC